MRIAVVTGASSGLGRDFVRLLSARGGLDEIWAIARRRSRLEQLRAVSACPVRVLPLDLTETESLRELEALLSAERPEIVWLINAAGFGRMGNIRELPAADGGEMIDLNCRAAVAVTALALPYVPRGGRILEICSTAGFQPMPGLGVYAATKAFLLSYTRTLHHEQLASGVHVTAVCPYWIKDTEFIGVARETSRQRWRHVPLASRSEAVAHRALRDSALNLWVSTPGLVCTVHRFFAKFIPHCIMVPLMDLFSRL